VDYEIFDAKTNLINYLYRGNSPVVNDSYFGYNELASYFKIRANDVNLTFPSSFYFIDVSLTDMFGKDYYVEKVFWAKHGNDGNFGILFHWAVLESPGLVPPNWIPDPILRNKLCDGNKIWFIDQIPTRISYVNSVLTSQRADKLPVVIYVHCEGGCDRTGEFIASYRLQYSKLQNITEIYNLDVQECGRAPNDFATSSIEWFCVCYKEQTKHYDIGNCEHLADCHYGGSCTV